MIQIVLYLMTEKCYANEKADGKEWQKDFSPLKKMTPATMMKQNHHNHFLLEFMSLVDTMER